LREKLRPVFGLRARKKRRRGEDRGGRDGNKKEGPTRILPGNFFPIPKKRKERGRKKAGHVLTLEPVHIQSQLHPRGGERGKGGGKKEERGGKLRIVEEEKKREKKRGHGCSRPGFDPKGVPYFAGQEEKRKKGRGGKKGKGGERVEQLAPAYPAAGGVSSSSP